MADRGGLLTLEDQGTIFMFSLLLALTIATVLYFACIWQRKKTKNKPAEQKVDKPAVSKTFSRFSHVDEELTVHMGTLDDIVDENECDDDENKSDKTNMTSINTDTMTKTDDRPPYLETDM